MKPKFVLALFGLVGLGLLSQPSQAGIVVAVGNDTFALNSGVQSIDVFVSSNAADTSLFFTADFRLAAGVFPTTAGVFGQAGMVGAGNIQAAPASQFISAGDNLATLSLDFTDPQLFPANSSLLGRMFIDTTGLASGTYAIQVTSVSSQASNSFVNGSFTIAPIPEPSSLCLVGIASLWALRRRLAPKRSHT